MEKAHDLAASFRALRRNLAGATDAQVLRILAAVEASPERGLADEFISPLRARLNLLRPPRKLRFRRLMFHPLNPIIVPPISWRADQPAVPRSVIAAIADHVRDAIPGVVASVEARIDGQTTAEMHLIEHAGGALWPAAAEVLREALPPPSWNNTGLTGMHFKALAPAIAAVLAQAPRLETLCLGCVEGILPPDLRTARLVINSVEADHPPSVPMILGVMLLRLPDVGPVFSLAAAEHPVALDHAIGLLVDRLEADGPASWIAGGSVEEAALAAGRLGRLLQRIERMPSRTRSPRCVQLREQLDAACLARAWISLREEFLPPLQGQVDSALRLPPSLEEVARGLRIMAAEATVWGNGCAYDALLEAAGQALTMRGPASHLGMMERLRLTEILQGPGAALEIIRPRA